MTFVLSCIFSYDRMRPFIMLPSNFMLGVFCVCNQVIPFSFRNSGYDNVDFWLQNCSTDSGSVERKRVQEQSFMTIHICEGGISIRWREDCFSNQYGDTVVHADKQSWISSLTISEIFLFICSVLFQVLFVLCFLSL